jgi:hypothetical protein
MVHLLPLPGSPRYGGSRQAILDRAVADARALERAGFDAVLVENYGDVPFHAGTVEPHVLADMTAIAAAVCHAVGITVGVQVLRNDAAAGLSIAAAVGASFVRVNVHTGAMITDQGIIQGDAAGTLRLRARIDSHVRIFADVFVKHARPYPGDTIETAAHDAVHRGCADALIVSGEGTGSATDVRDIERVRTAVPVPVYVGSGATPDTAAALLQVADGIIVGTSVKHDCITAAPVDEKRAAMLVQSARRTQHI